MTEEFLAPGEAYRAKYSRNISHREFGSSPGKKSKSTDTKGTDMKSILIGFDHVEAA